MGNDRKLRIAIVGLRHGSTYIPHVRRHARTELAAVVDIDARLLGDLSAACGVPGFAGVAEMLTAGVADAAILAVPTRYHAEASEACLDAGLHVLQEKPLCRNEDEARRIGRAVDRNAGRVFQVGFEMRSSPLHRAILDHVARGDLGRVTNLWYHQHTNKDAGFAGTWRARRSEMGGRITAEKLSRVERAEGHRQSRQPHLFGGDADDPPPGVEGLGAGKGQFCLLAPPRLGPDLALDRQVAAQVGNALSKAKCPRHPERCRQDAQRASDRRQAAPPESAPFRRPAATLE